MYSDNFSQFQVLPEQCQHHPHGTIEIYCSCKNKLCLICIRDHCHEGLYFESIKEKVSKFHTEVNQTLNFINTRLMNLKRPNVSQEVLKNLTKNVVSSLIKIKSKILELLNTRYFITFDILLTFQKGGHMEKSREILLDYYRQVISFNKNLVDSRDTKHKEKEILDNKQTLNKSISINGSFRKSNNENILMDSKSKPPISITNVMNVINMKIPDSKLSTISQGYKFPESNKENVDPLEDVYVSQFNQFLDENKGQKSNNNILTELKNTETTNKNSETKKWKSRKYIPSTVKSEPIMYSFQFENNNEFLDSSLTEAKSEVKLVCITCREKFSVTKDQSGWRNRCNLCTDNYEV